MRAVVSVSECLHVSLSLTSPLPLRVFIIFIISLQFNSNRFLKNPNKQRISIRNNNDKECTILGPKYVIFEKNSVASRMLSLLVIFLFQAQAWASPRGCDCVYDNGEVCSILTHSAPCFLYSYSYLVSQNCFCTQR